MERLARHVAARFYYYITPLFILLDYFFGINVRAAVLDTMPLYKNIYYGICIMCGVGVFVFPRLTPVVTLFDSTASILAIVLTVYLPYIHFITQTDDVLNADMPTVVGINAPCIINLVLVGTMAIIGFRGYLHELQFSMRPDRIGNNSLDDSCQV
jgi:hypothetical protein